MVRPVETRSRRIRLQWRLRQCHDTFCISINDPGCRRRSLACLSVDGRLTERAWDGVSRASVSHCVVVISILLCVYDPVLERSYEAE